jgi:sulfate transport system ATP-binding protein
MGIAVERLHKRFADDLVVDDVSFAAPKGQLTTLLGPSGSGKSTVLRMIAGLERPESGVVRIDGSDATHTSVQDRNVGFVFQQYALFRHMTVARNVAFGLEVRGRPQPEIDARVRELLRLFQIEEYGNNLPTQLSGGQRQRVALARALAPHPRVLLLDEPFGALDAKLRQELRAWLRQLHDEVHVTTLMVTHDQEEAMELSDWVVVMNAGKVEQAGTPAEIYDHPATPFVASFVGGANVLSGRVQNGQVALGSLRLSSPAPAGSEGQSVRAFVRPHDVVVAREPSTPVAAGPAPVAAASAPAPAAWPEAPARPNERVATARVQRLVRIGWMIKVHLLLSDDQTLVVQMTREQIEGMRIQEGDRVLVNLKEARVFVQDYSI